MRAAMDLGVEISQNRFLAASERKLHAVLKITARNRPRAGEPAAPGHPPGLAEVIVIDCSGSMGDPPTKIAAARRATAAAIEALPDGVGFAIVEGTHEARLVYPSAPPLASATAQTRKEATDAVAGLAAAGGTAIGTWLARARTLVAARPSAIGHVLLLTDGRNEHESPEALEKVLATCKGQFVCDARGIGDGWEPRELMRIAEVLQGTAAAVRRPAELTADFLDTMHAAMAKTVPEVRIRVDTMPWARVAFIKQVHPTIADLVEHRVEVDERTVEFLTRSWGDESRDYHVCLELDPANLPMFKDVRVARIDLLAAGEHRAGPATALVHLTDDPVAHTRIDPAVAHYTGQEEVSRVLVAGCDAHQAGDRKAAEEHWANAVRMAAEANNVAALERLEHLVEILDAGEGRIRLREDLRDIDRKLGWLQSSYTTNFPARNRTGKDPAEPPRSGQSGGSHCGRVYRRGDARCEICGADLGTAGSMDAPAGGDGE
jgi:von Willebrand factor type A domain